MSSDELEIEDLAISREEATETLRAIRSGRADAIVVAGANGHEVLTFRDPDHAYRALVEAMGEGAALVTLEGVICYHNPRFAELTVGPSTGSVRGRALRTLVAADAVSSIDAVLERALHGPARIEVGLASVDGHGLPVQLTASAASVADVRVLCVVITDLREQRLQAELYREALVGMEARERLISIAGHELRAPSQGLVFELAVLLAQQRGREARSADAGTTIEQLDSLHRQALHLAELVGSLLDVGLVGSGQLELAFEELDLAEVVRAVIARSSDPTHNSPVTLEARSVRGRWDRLRLEQVVTNLLSNARKYGLDRPIRVVVEGDNVVARLVVEDHGIGVPADATDRLFRPFERISSVKTATGLGLGLYITAQIVKAHRGVIRVDSDPEGGTRFVVELPCS